MQISLNSTFEGDENINVALAVAYSSNEAIRNLYRTFKDADRKYSMSFFCKKASISSTGYLSDVIQGKRKLHKKYWNKLAKAFGLVGIQEDYFLSLLELDTKPEEPNITEKIQNLRKTMRIRRLPIPEKLSSLFESIEVFCSFGLFSNTPTKKQLKDFFKNDERVERALEILLKHNLIESEGERFTVTDNQVIFGESQGGVGHLDFLRYSLNQASKDVEKWFERKDESHFLSTIISVKTDEFKQHLPHCKQKIFEMISKFESDEADNLIAFNIQVYPKLDLS